MLYSVVLIPIFAKLVQIISVSMHLESVKYHLDTIRLKSLTWVFVAAQELALKKWFLIPVISDVVTIGLKRRLFLILHQSSSFLPLRTRSS